jgi:hypothetical protein
MKKKLTDKKWCAMNMPLSFQGTVEGRNFIHFDKKGVDIDKKGVNIEEKEGKEDSLLVGEGEREEDIEREGRKEINIDGGKKENERVMNPHSLSLTPPEIMTMIHCSPYKKERYMNSNSNPNSSHNSKSNPKNVIMSKVENTYFNPEPNTNLTTNPNPNPHEFFSKNENLQFLVSVVSKFANTNTNAAKKHRDLSTNILFDPNQALHHISTKLKYTYFNPSPEPNPIPNSFPSPESSQEGSLGSNPNPNDKEETEITSLISIPNSDHKPSPDSRLISLASLSRALDSVWDIFYPDGIKMGVSEREEAKQLLHEWANPDSVPIPNANPSANLNANPSPNPNPNPDDNTLFQLPKPRRPSPIRISRESSSTPTDCILNSNPDPCLRFNSPFTHSPNPNPNHNAIHNHNQNPNRNFYFTPYYNPNTPINFDSFKIWFMDDLIEKIHYNERNRLLDYALSATLKGPQKGEKTLLPKSKPNSNENSTNNSSHKYTSKPEPKPDFIPNPISDYKPNPNFKIVKPKRNFKREKQISFLLPNNPLLRQRKEIEDYDQKDDNQREMEEGNGSYPHP